MRKLQPESMILNQVRGVLQAYGWYVIRIVQGLGCHRGISDLIAVDKTGNVHFIEIKTKTGRLSEHQEAFKYQIESRGGSYKVIRSYEETLESLRKGGD